MNYKYKNNEALSEEYEDSPSETEGNYDNLSSHSCDSCGARLTVQEFELNEDVCEDCLWEQTSGLSDVTDDDVDDEID